MKEVFEPVLAVIVGVAADANTFVKAPSGIATGVGSGLFLADRTQGGALTSMCNGFVGAFLMTSLDRSCEGSLRAQLERQVGSYIPDNEWSRLFGARWGNGGTNPGFNPNPFR